MGSAVIAFCGFGTKFIESIRKPVQSRRSQLKVEIAIVSRTTDSHQSYVKRLAARVVAIADRLPNDGHDARIILVSARCGTDEDAIEREVFIPAVRRMVAEPEIQTSPVRARTFVNEIHQVLLQWEESPILKLCRPKHDAVALLPVRNSRLAGFEAWLERACHFETEEISHALYKRCTRLANGDGVRIRNLKFKGTVNPPGHPVRRCTDSTVCDLRARARIGHFIPARFEFDVTSTSELYSNRLVLCSGARGAIPRAATHLNMRINDDFKTA